MRLCNKPEQITVYELVCRVASNRNGESIRFTIDNTHMGGSLMQVHEFIKRDENIMAFSPSGRVFMHDLASLRSPVHDRETPADVLPFVAKYLELLGDVRMVTILPNGKRGKIK